MMMPCLSVSHGTKPGDWFSRNTSNTELLCGIMRKSKQMVNGWPPHLWSILTWRYHIHVFKQLYRVKTAWGCPVIMSSFSWSRGVVRGFYVLMELLGPDGRCSNFVLVQLLFRTCLLGLGWGWFSCSLIMIGLGLWDCNSWWGGSDDIQ